MSHTVRFKGQCLENGSRLTAVLYYGQVIHRQITLNIFQLMLLFYCIN